MLLLIAIAKAMALGVVGSDGQKMPLHWFTAREGQRGVNQKHYVEVLEEIVLPWIQSTYEDRDIVYCFQQVGA